MQQTSDYATAAIMRGSGWYPSTNRGSNHPRDVFPRREMSARRAQAAPRQRRTHGEAWIGSYRHRVELSIRSRVMSTPWSRSAIARGAGLGALFRLAGIIGITFTLRSLVPYLTC